MLNCRCKQCEASYVVSDLEREIHLKASPKGAEGTIEIPAPTLCPDCRLQRRLSWRNEYQYFNRSCDLCNRKIVSIHPPENSYPVYCATCWWGDGWDPTSYGRSVDLNRSFIEQFIELQTVVPQLAMINDNGIASENCEYCQDHAYSKDCYLATCAWNAQDVYYSSTCCDSKSLSDCDRVDMGSELAYECTDSQKLYSCSYLHSSNTCTNCHYGLDLRWCSDCIGCVGLRQKRYHIFNQPYSAEEYHQQLAGFNLSSRPAREKLLEHFLEFAQQFPRRAMHLTNCEDCEGNHLTNCRNVHGFDIIGGEHSRYIFRADRPMYSTDLVSSGKPQWCYDGITPDESYATCFGLWCWKDHEVYYSDNCHSSKNLFGCISVRRREFCILNRPYRAGEYQQLLTQIISGMKQRGEWGEFFPMRLSPFPYNLTLAQEIYPLTADRVTRLGLRWSQPPDTQGVGELSSPPDTINELSDSDLDKIYQCAECSKSYRLIKREADLYRKLDLPPPGRCWYCRHLARWKRRPPYHMSRRSCDRCGIETPSVFPPEYPSQVYCVECYSSWVMTE